jgi:ubiquinone/menaquinone biosynthesis C-methylase UbiE
VTRDPYRNKVGVYAAVIDRLNAGLHHVAYKSRPGRPGMRVLDVGCGTGAQLTAYVEAGCIVSGVDTSPAMLAKAQDRFGSDADLRLADATELPYNDGEFDLVLASMFLHELDAPIRSAVLSELDRVLAADGAAVIIEFGAGRLTLPGRVRRAISGIFERSAGREHHRNFRAFLAADGLPGALRESPLKLTGERSLGGGDILIGIAERR